MPILIFSKAAVMACFVVMLVVSSHFVQAREDRADKHVSEVSQDFDIPAQPLAQALADFAMATGIKYVASSRHLAGKSAQVVKGRMSAEQALERLLQGSGLAFSNNKGTFLIKKIKRAKLTIAAPSIEEVYVTANKRRELSQDVPIAVTSLSGDNLAASGITETRQIYQRSPSMSFHNAKAYSGQGIRIRGIGTAVLAGGVEQSVGTLVDGVMTGSGGSGLQELWDVERIEVLRGPQGMLFGKNVSAGMINQITKNPSDELEMQLKLRYETEYEARRWDGVISGPINEHLGYRIAAFDLLQEKGSVKNIVRDEYENTEDRRGIRIKLHYEPENSWLNFSYAFNEADERCCQRVFRHLEPEYLSGLAQGWLVPAIERNALDVSEENRYSIAEKLTRFKAETHHAVIDSGMEFSSGHRFKSLTGHRIWKQDFLNDEDSVDRDLASDVGEVGKLELYSQEFQWLSPEDTALQYVLGAYFLNQVRDRAEPIGTGVDFAASLGVDAGTTWVVSESKVEHYALFGQASYELTPRWKPFAGLRLQRERISSTGQQQGDFWLWPTDYPENHLSASDSDYSARAGLQFRPHDDRQWYFSVSRGYKGQAIDNPANSIFFRAPQTLADGSVVPISHALLDPETVLAYELGTKNFFFDHRVMFNAALFHSRFNNYQTSVFDNTLNSFRLANAGVVESQGLELEWQAKPWQGASISGNLSWIDASFVDFNGAPCQVSQVVEQACDPQAGGQNVDGKSLHGTPKWQFYLQAQQSINTDLGEWYGDISYAWRDDVTFGSDLDPNTRQSAFALVDMKVGLLTANMEFALFMNNALDTHYTNRIIDAVLWRGAYSSYPEKGRTMGLEWTYRY